MKLRSEISTPSDRARISTKWVFLAAASLTLAVDGAVAQDMDALLKRKYEIQQQEADANTMRAEADMKRAEAEVRRGEAITNSQRGSSRTFSVSNSQTYYVPAGIDSLAGTDAATFRMRTGVVLRVSGDFRPDPPTICVAYCTSHP